MVKHFFHVLDLDSIGISFISKAMQWEWQKGVALNAEHKFHK